MFGRRNFPNIPCSENGGIGNRLLAKIYLAGHHLEKIKPVPAEPAQNCVKNTHLGAGQIPAGAGMPRFIGIMGAYILISEFAGCPNSFWTTF